MINHEAAENYLEAIYMLLRRRGYCRSIDVCRELGYSKPTISIMMKNLREAGYISIDDTGGIALTATGLEVAQRMYERHETIAQVLMKLGVPEDVAYTDSCKIEHDLSAESFEAILRYVTEHGIIEDAGQKK